MIHERILAAWAWLSRFPDGAILGLVIMLLLLALNEVYSALESTDLTDPDHDPARKF